MALPLNSSKVERFQAEMDCRHSHIAMEWKDPNSGPECLMPSFLMELLPPDALGEDANEGSEVGFEKHGLSVAVNSPQDEGQNLQLTPNFGQRSSSSSRLSERVQARAGFSIPKLRVPPIADDRSGTQSGYLTIPAGLSPTMLLESPVFLSNAMGQASPTTGKLLMLRDTGSNDPPIEDGPDAFCFKSLELRSSQYISEEKKESFPNNQHPSAPSPEVCVTTEANTQTADEANLSGHLNRQQLNSQAAHVKSSYHDPRLNHPAHDAITGNNDNASPPDHGQPAADSEGKGDYPAVATATPAEDGYSWRKYGQKQVKHSEYPRSYYKCTHLNCQVKKKVERSHEGHVTEIIYKGAHNHPKPVQSRRPGAPHPHPDAQMDAPDNSPNAEARPPWHSNATVPDWRGDGLEATSPPSGTVPGGELCDSSASMQAHDGGARFESPEGVDVTSAVSDEVDGGDRVVAHGGVSQGAADAEGDELESKRRKLESPCAIEMSTASRAVREPRVVIQTTSEVDILDDGYRWRKYGQKVVKGNPNPRSYYKCTHPGCSVRKHVERASHDLKSVITTYEGKHNHEVPVARNSGHPASGAAAASQAHAGARRPEPPSMQDGLMRLGGCGYGLPPRDPLGPMSNFPYSLGHTVALPGLQMPSAGLGAVEGLKLPMLAPSLHPLWRHQQAMETAGFRMPKGEVKDEAMPSGGGGGGGTGASSAFQQIISRRPALGHRTM